MPSHPKGKQPKSQGNHPHGPLKRSGKQAQTWEDTIGPSISVLPGHQLPQIKTVLQRYRALRIELPKEKTYKLASNIAEEVTAIWTRARVPTIAAQNVTNKVVQAIEWWNSKHNTEPRCQEFAQRLLDIAPKLRGKVSEESQLDHLKNLMRQGCAMQRRKSEGDKYDWEVDFQFYVDQAKVGMA